METNLVGTTGEQPRLQQRSAIRAAREDFELSARGQARFGIDFPQPHIARLFADRRGAHMLVPRGMAGDIDQIRFLDLAPLELRLEDSREMPRTRDDE